VNSLFIYPFQQSKNTFFLIKPCRQRHVKGVLNHTEMKKVIAVLSFILLVGMIETQAQSTPAVNQRQKAQHHRIREGVASGELTRPEAADARHDQRKIRRTERRVKADGVVTPNERARVHHKQNKASRELRRNKHDAQHRT
jgi:hypothetical protein